MTFDEYTNTEFSRELAAEKASAMMRGLALVTSRTGFSLSPADLEEIERAKDEVTRKVDLYFEMIREVAAERRANLERYQDIKLVSLGEDCFSRTLATQWGLKKCAKLGELSHPFDLAVHPLPRLSKLVKTDFQDYMRPEDLTYQKEGDICRNQALNISFDHERGQNYAENDFALLREIYQCRVGNFKRCLAEGGKMVFLLHLLQTRPGAWNHLNHLARSLQQKCKSPDFLLICLNTTGTDDITGASAARPDDTHESIVLVNAPYPTANYIWYAPKDCLDPEGHKFEKNLVASIKTIIDRKW